MFKSLKDHPNVHRTGGHEAGDHAQGHHAQNSRSVGTMARMSRPIIKKLITGAMPAILKFMLMNSGMKVLRTFYQ